MNQYQIKDRIHFIDFEINRLSKRKVDCAGDSKCVDNLEHEILILKTEKTFLTVSNKPCNNLKNRIWCTVTQILEDRINNNNPMIKKIESI